MSFVIARQAIFDQNQEVIGYEVYLRKSEDLDHYPEDVPFNKATFIVAELIAEIGMQKVAEGKKVFMNVTLDSILNKVLDLLTPEKMVFELIPSKVELGQSIYQNVLKRIDELKGNGAEISLHEGLYSSKYIDLLERSNIIEMTAENLEENRILGAKRNQKKVLISKIEDESQYAKAKALADYFEGNYLQRPSVIKEFEIAPFLKTTLLRMISALNTALSIRDFANIISSDVGMSAKLLRFVNSAYFAHRKEIKDIIQACSYLGMENLKKFTLLVATNDYVTVENPELWKKSLVRATIAEEIARKLKPDLANEAYLVGLFSLIDEILNVDKVEFLKEVNVDQIIIDTFTGNNPLLEEILNTSIVLENAILEGDEEKINKVVSEVSEKVGIESYKLKNKLLDALTKAEEVLKL